MTGKETKSSHVLVYYPESYKSWDWARTKLEVGTLMHRIMEVADSTT